MILKIMRAEKSYIRNHRSYDRANILEQYYYWQHLKRIRGVKSLIVTKMKNEICKDIAFVFAHRREAFFTGDKIC